MTSEADDSLAESDNGNHEASQPPVRSSAISRETQETAKQPIKKMLAQYSIPIGASEATITFTGEKLAVEDFDALADYVAIFKKQFERKQAAENKESSVHEPKVGASSFPKHPQE